MAFCSQNTHTHTHSHAYKKKHKKKQREQNHIGLMCYNPGWHNERHEWTLNDTLKQTVNDMGLVEYKLNTVRCYDCTYNDKKKQFEILVFCSVKDRTPVYDICIKYDKNTKQLIICSTHLKSNIQCVTKYVKKA